jgi:hypothetical protein
MSFCRSGGLFSGNHREKEFRMPCQRLYLLALVFACPLTAFAQASGGVTVIDNPGGGTIAYAQMPLQHTLQGALGKVLQYAHSRFGAKPQVDRVMRGADGNSLAVTFTVKSTTTGGQDIAGLALVAVSQSGPGKGALLFDQADRFRTTAGPMLNRLLSGAGLSAAGAGSQASATSASGAAPAAPAPIAPSGSAASSTANSSAKGPAAPAAPLHQTPFPDGSGSIGLPDGWTLTGAHAGEVTAQGPAPAALHFDWQISALDSNDPRSLNLRRGVGAGSFTIIPYGTDGANTFKAAFTQFIQRQHKPVPSIDIIESTQLSPQETIVVADIGSMNGQSPTRDLIDVGIAPKNQLGGYLITLYIIGFPQQLAAQNQATVTAIFHSYKVNTGVQLAQIHADSQATQAFTQSTIARMNRNQDAQDRQFQAFDNNLLDRTVIRDSDWNAQGTVSDGLADALVKANPNRFQEVPPSQYIKGIDY